jgi:hypothetical protein
MAKILVIGKITHNIKNKLWYIHNFSGKKDELIIYEKTKRSLKNTLLSKRN